MDSIDFIYIHYDFRVVTVVLHRRYPTNLEKTRKQLGKLKSPLRPYLLYTLLFILIILFKGARD